jgi:uncharacterized protein YgfB (UPF0149 family)
MSRQLIRTIAVILGVLVVWATVEPAWAQRGRGFRRLFGVPRAQLAALPDVQTELKLDDEQKTIVTEVNDQLRQERRDLLGTGFDGWSAIQGRMEQLNSEASKKVNDALKPEQRTRLQQISIQQNGPRSLQDADVVAELGLSDEQKTKLVEAVSENTKAFESGFGGGDRESWRQQAGELADQADERLMGVLTDEQKTKLEQLKGEPFDIDMSQFRRGRRDR